MKFVQQHNTEKRRSRSQLKVKTAVLKIFFKSLNLRSLVVVSVIFTNYQIYKSNRYCIASSQWRTEEGVRGVRTPPIWQINVPECIKIWHSQQKIGKIFLGVQPPPQTIPPVGRGIPLPTPNPLGACGTSTPPILKFWVRHCQQYLSHKR